MSGLHSSDLSKESGSITTTKRGDQSPLKPKNAFKNDGSFLEIFRLLHQEKKADNVAGGSLTTEAPAKPSLNVSSPVPSTSRLPPSTSGVDSALKVTKKKSSMSFVGKQRGGRVLPTGVVKKLKKPDPAKEGATKNNWSEYMEEVRKYREHSCEEDGKTRSLVK